MTVLYELRCDHCDKKIFEKEAVRCIDLATFTGLAMNAGDNFPEADFDYQNDQLIIAQSCFDNAIAGYFIKYQVQEEPSVKSSKTINTR